MRRDSDETLLIECDIAQANEYELDSFSKHPKRHTVPPLDQTSDKTWFPWILRMMNLVSAAHLLLAACLLLMLKLNAVSSGWPALSASVKGVNSRFLYSVPPVLLSVPLVAMWAMIDYQVKKIQPFLDLAMCSATREQSFALNYLETSRFIVWIDTLRNRHFAATFSTLACLVALSFQPLASALLLVKDVSVTRGALAITVKQATSITQTSADLLAYVAAAGYIESASSFAVSPPAFVLGEWALPTAQWPLIAAFNDSGAITYETTAIQSQANCSIADQVVLSASEGGSSLSATGGDCSLYQPLFQSASSVIIQATEVGCDSTSLGQTHWPVAFLVVQAATLNSTAQASVAFCRPYMLQRTVMATVDYSTSRLLSIVPLGSSTSTTNVTVSNGIYFNATSDPYISPRVNVSRAALPVAIYQSALRSPLGAEAVHGGSGMTALANSIYTLYLSIAATRAYMSDQMPATQSIADWTGAQTRLIVSPAAAYALALALLINAGLGMGISVIHQRSHASGILPAEPGTIAACIALAERLGVNK
ncbi:uncharacterized protein L969DRAFT_104283 [Mixia osmundae IAM 14324]|uniref:Uncharacterized protein n=1 Tax=Mixia osmundae (strain CBS 9802 / IAM 14324 / JCM 22182 / KY 12970) TaxID=764103 RepID=G7E7J9_MIXOS|nr:uncharacterized protein L969DRAFT_104283 [Mixia osmundae IAM 14324]KEI38411.1 hypothetical protein L969DRAFT_104283 [Mixia osmundae IAM 14324]GAA98809.1 hypothetical protein E5Q_05497 [Mixia osmundae IAM 14324]